MESVEQNNVWKIGSRWSDKGKPNSSILSIFRRNNVVFVGSERGISGMAKVKCGDYFAIADGYEVVAIARAITEPKFLRDFQLIISGDEKKVFNNYEEYKDYAKGVKVQIVDLKDSQKYIYKDRHSFCRATSIRDIIIPLFKNNGQEFSINAYTSTLLYASPGYKSIFNTHTRFIIPVYQRPYSWVEKEIRPFLSDLVNSYWGKDRKGTIQEPMFIGTMQLSARKYIDKGDYEQEVIDGQQRLTTLSILLKVLKAKYPECTQLANLSFNWLESRVNKTQNEDLYNYFSSNQVPDCETNVYSKNAILIHQIISDLIDNESEDTDRPFCFDIKGFCDFLFSRVYFVVIETYAGLSKTIQIFNTINTTGLDLNGGDLFKIRMYEYLTDKKNVSEGAFESISAIYQLIDEKNKQSGNRNVYIQDVLETYKDILISKYDLPDTLFQFGWETFFERLFDVLLGIREWEHFGKVATNGVDILLDEIREVVEVRSGWDVYSYFSMDSMFAFHLIQMSRYGRYWKSAYLFLYAYKEDPDRYAKLSVLLIALCKLFFLYSVIFAKSIYEIHEFMGQVQKQIINSSFDEVMKMINNKTESVNQQEMRQKLSAPISDNAKKKNLVCCLSAYLDECSSNEIYEVKRKLFDIRSDIEHIHATNDKSIEVEVADHHSIGNLVKLEEDINRRIKDANFMRKREEYLKSIYNSVQQISKNCKWEEDDILKRKNEETNKMLKYLFG